MKRLLTLLLVVLALGWGGYQATAWYGAHSALTELARDFSRWGDLRWDSIRVGTTGEVRVQGVRWHWFDITQPVEIEEAALQTSGPVVLLGWLYGGQQPERWTLSVSDLSVQLEPDLFRPWARAHRSLFLERHPLHLQSCGERQALTPTDLLKMGIDRIEGDLELTDEGPEGDLRRYLLSVNSGHLGSVDGVVRAGALNLGGPSGELIQMPEIAGLDLVVRDAGLMRRFSSFCAAAQDKTVEDWAEASARNWQQQMTERGYVPTGATRDFFREWFLDGGELEISWHPTNGFLPSPDQELSATEWREQAGLALAYNGEPVEDIGISLRPGERAEEPTRQVEPQDMLVTDPELSMSTRYHESEIERAAAWLDRRVRLTLSSGREIEGQLAARDERSLHVLRRVDGGELVAPFALDDIERFEVWRRPGDPGRPIAEDEPEAGSEDVPGRGLRGIQPIPLPQDTQ